MRTIVVSLVTLLCIVPAQAVVVTCVNEGNNVVRIDYSASDETVLPVAFALDVTVDGGAVVQTLYDYKVGDSTATSRGFGIFLSSMQFDDRGMISNWGSPDMSAPGSANVQPGVGSSGVTLGLASRYDGPENAPLVQGTLCRIRVDPRGAATVNVRIAQNAFGGGVVLENTTPARFTGVGCVLGVVSPVPPQLPASITYPTTSSTGKYTVSWPASSGATSYRLERTANNAATWTAAYSGTALSYAETVPNGTYRYRVRATNSAGASDWMTGLTNCVVSITAPSAPQPPASIAYPTTSSTGKYTVSWPASSGATSYQLERTANNGTTWTAAHSGAALSYAETVPNGSYRYRVRAVNSAGSSSWQTGSVNCAVSISSPPVTGAFRQSTEANGIVSIEAEHFHNKTSASGHNWNQVTTPAGFSDAGAMRAEPDNGAEIESGYVSSSPRVDFSVRFVKTGRHYIWVRTYATGGDDDSCHAGLGGTAPKSAQRISKLPAMRQWVWTSTAGSYRATVDVSNPGVTTVNLWMHKDGLRVDKIVLTTDAGYRPTGNGPAESPRDSQ